METSSPTPGEWSEQYPRLCLLFGGYLNLDWPEEYGSPERAVHDFMHEVPADAVRQAAAELRQLRAAVHEESAGNALEALGCGFHPPGAGMTLMGWLEQVQTRLDDAVRARA